MPKILLFCAGLYWYDYDPAHRQISQYAEGVPCECPKAHQGVIEVGDTVHVNPMIGTVFCAKITNFLKP